jgi:Fe-S cluster assembly protein SufB
MPNPNMIKEELQQKETGDEILEKFANRDYKWGFVSDVEADTFEPGLNEGVIRRLSEMKGEPEWMLEWRLKAYRHLLTLDEPKWPNVKYQPIDLQSISYYSAPKKKPVLDSLEDADPELLRTFEKLGIPIQEQMVLLNVKGAAETAADARARGGAGTPPDLGNPAGAPSSPDYTREVNEKAVARTAPRSESDLRVAAAVGAAPVSPEDVTDAVVAFPDRDGLGTHDRDDHATARAPGLQGVAIDAVFDSVSVATTFKKKLAELGIIFCSMSEAVREHPELVKKHLGSVVPYSDNYYATLNSAAFSDGSFVYVPKGVKCPMELSTYFRINAENTGQFERTLIIAEEGSYVSYLEGCTAPMRDENQLHAAVVELVCAGDDATIKYSTVQNWYPGDPQTGKGGIFNFVTKRGRAIGKRSKITWTQVETGSAITWKYPSVMLQGDDSVGEFYSVALTAGKQQADTGTKMIHLGKRTKSTIVSKGISAGNGQNTYRGLVKINPGAEGARNYSQCDSMLMGDRCGAHTFPYIEVKNPTATVEHEASTSKIGEDQIFYCNQRGIPTEDAVNMIVSGFCKEVFRELPMEFAVEAQKLLGVSLEGSVG